MYTITLNSVLHKLAKTESEARKAFYKLMDQAAPATDRKPGRHLIRWLCDRYFDRTKEGKDPETWRAQLGHRPVDSLKAHVVNDWLDGTELGGSMIALAV